MLFLAGACLAQGQQMPLRENESQIDPGSWLLPLNEAASDALPNGLLYERWNGIKGETVSDLLGSPLFRQAPASKGIAAVPEFPQGDGIDFGVRLRGYFVAPRSGSVRLVLSADDNAEVWMSPNDSPFSRKKVAWLSGAGWYGSTPPGETSRARSQWSDAVQVEAGRSYYIEAYHKEAGGEDHFQLMWQFDGKGQPAVIPREALRPWTPSQLDADDDGLPDVWQSEKGLAGRADAAWWQDADGDGLSNYEEFTGATEPLDASSVTGSALLEIWYGIPGHDVAELRRDQRFSKPSHCAMLVQGAATPKLWTSHFGSRVSGFIVPDESGRYEIAVASDDSAELWLSPDSSRFNKKRVAYADNWRGGDADGEWASSPANARAGVDLEAGRSYYFELLHQDNVEPGWSGLGWRKEGEKSFRPIMPAFLRSPGKDPADLDRNGLPDEWAAPLAARAVDDEYPVDASEFGDADGDGISNLSEFQNGTDPFERNTVPGAFAREWWFNVPGISLDSARKKGTFLKPSSMLSFTAGSVGEMNAADFFASRLRATLIAPVTGEYRIWIAGDNQCELWLSDNGHKFAKREIAGVMPAAGQNPEADIYVRPEQWDDYPGQKSEILELKAGEARFIEILHKEGSGRDLVEIAWQYREQGGEWGERVPVPAVSLVSFAGDDDDLDDDYLPDSWEERYGLDLEDNGLKDGSRQGEYGDFDGDLLTNHEEFMLGTNPALADTDGDGMRDHDEVKLYESDPNARDASPPVKFADINLRRFDAAPGTWSARPDGSLVSLDRRGAADFNLNIEEPGVYLLELCALTRASGGYAPPVPVIASIDGARIGDGEVLTDETVLRWFTPVLAAGSHSISIDNRNVRLGVALEIKSISLYRHPGEDRDGNGIADWMQKAILKQNGVSEETLASAISPLCLEGKARLAGTTSILHQSGELAVMEGLQGGWYVNVPLGPDGDTPVTIRQEGGAFTVEKSLTWTTTNLFATPDAIRVRKGDSLKLSALPSGVDGASVQARITLGDTKIGEGMSGAPCIAEFPEAGSFVLHATAVAGTETLDTTTTVEVVEVDFGPEFSVATNAPRTWRIGGVPQGLALDTDPQLELEDKVTDPARPRAVSACYTGEAAARPRVLARLNPSGPVVGATTLNVFHIVGAGKSRDTRLIDVLPDGTRVFEFMVMIDGVIPADFSTWLRLYIADAVFADGTASYHLTAADFDKNGIARILIYKAPGEIGSVAKICHLIRPYEDDKPLEEEGEADEEKPASEE